ncbi:MAG: type IX secretion system membrane protein PorP/SprF [Clostridia bacterium]|nr:type IX secretion system membrane protein PorP/SprF [Clostridia bacterium]
MKKDSITKWFFFSATLFLLTPALMWTQMAAAQDATYSQFYNNRLYYNPAYAGASSGLHVNMHYRNQWNKLSCNFDNYTLSVDVAEPNFPGSGGLGVIIQSDMDGLGNVQTTSATLATSVKIHMSENLLTQFGLNAAFVRKSINWDNLIFSDQIDPRYGVVNPSSFVAPDYNSLNYPDFGAGILLKFCEQTDAINNVVGTLAVSVQHLFTPDISFYESGAELPIKLVVMGDLLLDNETGSNNRYNKKDTKFKVNPGFLYEKQGKMSNFSVGLNAYKSYIYSGIWIRNQSFTFTDLKDLIIMVGANVPFGTTSRIKIRYSYDYLLSDVRSVAGATHEVSVIYELDGFSFFGAPRSSSSRFGEGKQSCLDCTPF